MRYYELKNNIFDRGRKPHDLDGRGLSRIWSLLDFVDHDFIEIANQNGPLSGLVRQEQPRANRGLEAIAGIRKRLAEIL